VRIIAAVAAVLALGCTETEEVKQACGGSDARHYDEGLIFHLSKAGVPYRRMYKSGLCVDEKYASQLRAAERELERYYPQIAHNPRDSCEEKALVEWAEREKLRFDIRQAYDMKNRPSGKLFFLRPFNQEELTSYREKLDKEAPLGATCK
jgi:hypothetical protein